MGNVKPPHDLSDDQLRSAIDASAERTINDYADLRRGLERRSSERAQAWDRVLSIGSIAIAVAALLASALRS